MTKYSARMARFISNGFLEVPYITIPMKVGDTITLDTMLSDDTDESVTWKSSKSSVASVTKTGKVTAKAEGTAVITAKIGDSTARIAIKVTK